MKRLEDLGLDADATMTSLAKMFAGDFVLANRDRHYRNFGVIRNVETLEVTGIAPVFDSGSCLWSDAEFLEVPGRLPVHGQALQNERHEAGRRSCACSTAISTGSTRPCWTATPRKWAPSSPRTPTFPSAAWALSSSAVRDKAELLTRIAR